MREELKEMARRTLTRRIAGDIRDLARKIYDDPDKAAELLPQLKAYVMLLEGVK